MSKKLNGGGWKHVLQLVDLGFKICPKWPKSAFFLSGLDA